MSNPSQREQVLAINGWRVPEDCELYHENGSFELRMDRRKDGLYPTIIAFMDCENIVAYSLGIEENPTGNIIRGFFDAFGISMDRSDFGKFFTAEKIADINVSYYPSSYTVKN